MGKNMGKSSDDLAKLINEWIDEKPHRRDIALLSELTDVPYTTMRRVHQGGNPDCHTALCILSTVATREEALLYLKAHFPGAAKFLEPLYKSCETESVSSMRMVIKDPLSYKLVNLAYDGELITRAEIVERYGTKGLEVADSLCALGKTKWVDDYLKVASEAEFGLYENKEDVALGCRHIVDWSLEHGGYPVAMVGSVTPDEFREIESMTTEYVNGVTQRLTKSRGGSILLAVSTVFTKVFQRGGDQ
jgi:hypothetical protein